MTTNLETTEIYADLRLKLMTGGFASAEKLKPGALQGTYACSANTIRDVLMRLANVGLVEFELQRGFRSRAISEAARNDVTRFRVLLESEGASRSMDLGGVAWEAQLTAAHHKLSHIETRIARTGDPAADTQLWSDAEWEFHHTLIAACASPLLIETFSNVYAQFRQQMYGFERDFGEDYFRAIIAEHQAILDAALLRDPEACGRAIYNHLKRNLSPEAERAETRRAQGKSGPSS